MISRPRHKYNAKRTVYRSKNFDSKIEAQVCGLLDELRKDGRILFYLWQVPIHVQGHKPHRVDFLVFLPDSCFFMEVKGRDLSSGKTMRELSEHEIGCKIHVVRSLSEVLKLVESEEAL